MKNFSVLQKKETTADAFSLSPLIKLSQDC